VARSVLSLRGDAGDNDAVFASPRGGHITERAVNYMLKRSAARAGINTKFSAHWLRHAHASHSIDRGSPLPVVQATLGHGNVAVTSGYWGPFSIIGEGGARKLASCCSQAAASGATRRALEQRRLGEAQY
jgi:integrase/recombinase XerD